MAFFTDSLERVSCRLSGTTASPVRSRILSDISTTSAASWADVVRAPLATNQLINTVHGALRTYDLPDLLTLLPAERVSIVRPAVLATGP